MASFRQQMDDLYQKYVNLDERSLKNIAVEATDHLYTSLKHITRDGAKAFTIIFAFLSDVFAADGLYTHEEFDFFKTVTLLHDMDFDDFCETMNNSDLFSDYEKVISLGDEADIKTNFLILGVCAAAINKTITVAEKEKIEKYCL